MNRPAISDADQADLLASAKGALKNAYAPYSDYPVGAAVMTADGSVYTGANVENVTYGESLCAERVAVAKAVTSGSRDLVAIAVVAGNGKPVTPCGACRQVIVEFSPDCLVVMEEESGPRAVSASELLPEAFKF